MTLGAFLAILFTPVCCWFEAKKIKRPLATLFCTLIFLAIVGIIIYFFIGQINSISNDIAEIQKHVNERVVELKEFLNNKYGITNDKLKKFFQTENDVDVASVINTVGSLAYFVTSFIIMLVYLFMLLLLRGHIKKFILKLVPETQKQKTERILDESGTATQHYLMGFALLVCMLWILYGIAFTIIGVRNAFFFGALCGLLEIIPFIGSLVGIILTMLMVISQGGGGGMIFFVFVVYVVLQFTQFYIIQPLLLGGEVDINPLIAITVLIFSELVWGLGGMILAIPITGIFKIVCDNVEALHPYGFLLGKGQRSGGSIFNKIKNWASSKKKKTYG